MKRKGNIYSKIYEEDNLKLAFLKASKGKQERSYVSDFRKNLTNNIRRLQKELIDKNLNIGNYRFFYVHDPKVRLICEAEFHERVLHHAIMNICGEYIEQSMIFDSYACRKNKGTHKAIKKSVMNSKQNKWYLKLDIKKYFNSINHEILLELYKKHFKDKDLLDLFQQITNSYFTKNGYGLPLGGLFSQYSANVYLNSFDHFVKEDLKCKYYVRYMDDFILWGNSLEKMKYYLSEIKEYLSVYLELELKNDIQLNVVNHGIPFLGYRIYSWGLKLKKESFKRFKRRLITAEKAYGNNLISENKLVAKVGSIVNFASYGLNIQTMNRIINKYSVYY